MFGVCRAQPLCAIGGAAHNEIKLSPEDDGEHEAISEEGMVLV